MSLRSKQPKRAVISCDEAYIEVMEYPRADRATIVWTQTGEAEQIAAGDRERALCYVLSDLEAAAAGEVDASVLMEVTADVMRMMTGFRRDWGLLYPGES